MGAGVIQHTFTANKHYLCEDEQQPFQFEKQEILLHSTFTINILVAKADELPVPALTSLLNLPCLIFTFFYITFT